MLREFVEKNHFRFADEAKDWKDAIRMSCETLEADGTVEENYKEDIIACVEKYGPYIMIAPNIAMPHAQEGARGVNKTEIAFMKLKKPVSFEPGNPEMEAQLFFTLASCNPDQHLDNMSFPKCSAMSSLWRSWQRPRPHLTCWRSRKNTWIRCRQKKSITMYYEKENEVTK